ATGECTMLKMPCRTPTRKRPKGRKRHKDGGTAEPAVHLTASFRRSRAVFAVGAPDLDEHRSKESKGGNEGIPPADVQVPMVPNIQDQSCQKLSRRVRRTVKERFPLTSRQ